jgi:serine/threonine protein kinase
MIGQVVAGYRLLSELGQGGFGTAYLAERGGETYVVKFLRADATTVTHERFDREIKSLTKVAHPLVASYVDHGQIQTSQGPRNYLVMPYRPGRTLFQAIQEAPIWPADRVTKLGLDLCEALAAVHSQDIVHRDVKPKNVWILEDGRASLLDFGIAKLLDYSSITQGMAPLTWRYASPEQPLDSVDGRSDLYSLGVVMYELLTGRPVFQTQDPFAFLKRLREDLPDLPSFHNPDVPPALENIVMRLLQKQPHRRYRSARDLHAALIAQMEDAELPPASEDTGAGPRAFVHLQHNESEPLRLFLREGGRVSGLIYGASQLESSRKPVSIALSGNVPVVVDPETHRLARADFSRTAGLRSLPYVTDPMTPIRHSDFDSVDDYAALASKVVDFQEDAGADFIVAPYFHFPDADSDWLRCNVKLLAEARRHMTAMSSVKPLWAAVSTDVETFGDDRARSEILNRYSRHQVDGFWFLVNFDELNAGPAQAFNYARLLLEFRSLGKPVVAGRVGSFGLGLAAAGVTGFSSGMTSLENFAWRYFTDRSQVSGGQQRYYLRPLLQNLTIDTVDAVLRTPWAGNFKCDCPGCAGSIRDRLSWVASRVHFLHTRQWQLEALMRTPARERLTLFRQWVESAQRLATDLNEDGFKIRRDHFATWLMVLTELAQRGLVRAA